MADFVCGALIIFVIVYNVVLYKTEKKRVYSYKKRKAERQRRPIFNDEERLALGLYPKNEYYKMSIISKILNK